MIDKKPFYYFSIKSVFRRFYIDFNKFDFRTRGSLLLSELLASSRIRHGGSPLSASHRKCISLSETVCHVINNLITVLARALLENIGPRWLRSVRTATTEGQYSPVRPEQARLVSCLLYGTLFLIVKCTSGGLHLKVFRRDVFVMTRATQTKASYHEFEKQIY